jgi:DNA-binding transcriptional regulator YiaG
MRRGDMTPTELERLRHELKISQERLAAFFAIGPRSMRRYVAGEQPIPRAIAYMLRLMVKHQVAPAALDRAFAE